MQMPSSGSNLGSESQSSGGCRLRGRAAQYVMLTIDEILAIPLFSGLAASELERLAQTSEDVHLGPGNLPSTKEANGPSLQSSPASSKS